MLHYKYTSPNLTLQGFGVSDRLWVLALDFRQRQSSFQMSSLLCYVIQLACLLKCERTQESFPLHKIIIQVHVSEGMLCRFLVDHKELHEFLWWNQEEFFSSLQKISDVCSYQLAFSYNVEGCCLISALWSCGSTKGKTKGKDQDEKFIREETPGKRRVWREKWVHNLIDHLCGELWLYPFGKSMLIDVVQWL